MDIILAENNIILNLSKYMIFDNKILLLSSKKVYSLVNCNLFFENSYKEIIKKSRFIYSKFSYHSTCGNKIPNYDTPKDWFVCGIPWYINTFKITPKQNIWFLSSKEYHTWKMENSPCICKHHHFERSQLQYTIIVDEYNPNDNFKKKLMEYYY